MNNQKIYKCVGCGTEIREDDGDHIFHCEGEGWKKRDESLLNEVREAFAGARERIGLEVARK